MNLKLTTFRYIHIWQRLLRQRASENVLTGNFIIVRVIIPWEKKFAERSDKFSCVESIHTKKEAPGKREDI